MAENYEQTLAHVNTNSKPTDLKITDMRFVDIVGAPMHCTLLRIETNQGITGYGEVRDGASKLYAQMLKRFLIGENPCNIDKIFRRIKQFGGQSRQAGGVCRPAALAPSLLNSFLRSGNAGVFQRLDLQSV